MTSMLRLSELRLPLDHAADTLPAAIAKRLGISPADLLSFTVFKRSYDARKATSLSFIYIIDLEVKNEAALLKTFADDIHVKPAPDTRYHFVGKAPEGFGKRPVVIGFGPCGIFAALVLAQIERIRAITRSLLQYSRPGDYETAPVWQHLNPIIEESLTLVRSALRQQQVNLVADLRAQQPIEADRQQLLQVLINLLVNASHALGEQGEIRVESRDWLDDAGALQGAEVRVIDNGSGIEAAIIDKIFDPFFTTRATGTGLGLALSHRIISRWGGELLVDSTPGQGSCFTVRLRSHALLPSGSEPAKLEGWRIALNAEGRETSD